MFDINKLTLEQKILQTKVALMEKGKRLKDKPGAAFFFGQIITEADDEGLVKLRSYVDEVYDDSHIPPLITSDFENGCGSMVKGLTQLPYMMGLGAANDEQLAYDYGKATALEALSLGANWTFSPVADLNLNKRNPLVNVRGMTDDADLAEKLLPLVVKGMQDNGLAACAKHFPGDGVDYRDQHIVTTNNTLSFDEWEKTYGKVFQALIDNGVDSIMPGHITLPAYQKERDPEFNMPYPATLSYELITELLKNKMGFKGVVVTDALNMGGFNGYYETKEIREIESFKAGCDMMLWPTESYVENMKKAIESGYISMERLDDAVTRIIRLKEKLGLFDENRSRFKNLTNEEKEFVRNTQKKVSERSVTLLRNTENMLPVNIDKIKKILLVPVINHEPSKAVAEHFRSELEKRGMEVIYKEACDMDFLKEQGPKVDMIIYAMFSRPFRPIGFLDFYDATAWNLAFSLGVERKKTMAISFGSPYFYKQYFERCHTFINAYSMLDTAVDAVVCSMFGESPFNEFSPVDLQGKI